MMAHEKEGNRMRRLSRFQLAERILRGAFTSVCLVVFLSGCESEGVGAGSEEAGRFGRVFVREEVRDGLTNALVESGVEVSSGADGYLSFDGKHSHRVVAELSRSQGGGFVTGVDGFCKSTAEEQAVISAKLLAGELGHVLTREENLGYCIYWVSDDTDSVAELVDEYKDIEKARLQAKPVR